MDSSWARLIAGNRRNSTAAGAQEPLVGTGFRQPQLVSTRLTDSGKHDGESPSADPDTATTADCGFITAGLGRWPGLGKPADGPALRGGVDKFGFEEPRFAPTHRDR